MAHTYVAALDRSGARTFWDITALHNYTASRADATNAFAEAPSPTAPLYVTIDKQYKRCWEDVLKHPPTTVGHILPVKYSLQGHPESPRLWGGMIHSILTNRRLNFKSTTHKPCLYTGDIDGHPIFLLRQVDNFAMAAPTEAIKNNCFPLYRKNYNSL